MDPRSLDPVWTESQPIATMDPNAGRHDRPTADDGRGAPGLAVLSHDGTRLGVFHQTSDFQTMGPWVHGAGRAGFSGFRDLQETNHHPVAIPALSICV